MKSLKRIQTMAKVLKILFTIVYVACVVGAIFSMLGLALTPIVANNETLRKYVLRGGAEFNLNSYLATCICAVITCGTWFYLGYKNVEFYKYELKTGTPFDKTVTVSLRKLAFEAIIISCVANIIEVVICCLFYVEIKDFGVGEIGTGIVYLLISLILDYGADLNQEKEKIENVDDKELN